MKRWGRIFACGLLAIAAVSAARASDIGRVITRAETAVRERNPSAPSDLAGLIDALRASRNATDQVKLIEAIGSIGDARGASPAAVKAYLREVASGPLLDIARSRAEWMVRGEALTCLRTLDASDAVLDQAIAIAEADVSPQRGFFLSRGEILRSWKQSRIGGVSGAGVAKPVSGAAEQSALEFLRKRDTGVSYDSLLRAIGAGDGEMVQALLDAGVSVGAGDARRANEVVISGLSIACGDPSAPPERIVKIIDILVKGGFRLGYVDANGNTLMMSAAQFCAAPVAARLIELGAEVDPINKQNFTPLEMAFVSGKWDMAKVLIDHGARLTKQKSEQLFIEMPQDPAERELVARATQ